MKICEIDIKKIIKKIQNGCASPLEQKFVYDKLIKAYKPHTYNYIYDQDEIKNEFLFHAWNALYRVNLNIGDPICFAVKRGRGAMIDYYRKISSQNLWFFCQDCGHRMAYDRRTKKCKKCQSKNLISLEKIEYTFTSLVEGFSKGEEEKIIMEDFFERLIKKITDINLFSQKEKDILIKAIEEKQDIYKFSRKLGISYRESKRFSEKVQRIFKNLSFF